MIPNPLHPAVVHFPIVFMVLLPLVALGALWAIRRGTAYRKAWLFPVAVAAALALSGLVALKTGQAQEDKVENVVPENAINAHEESAELFLVLSTVLFVVAAVGLVPGVFGRAARGVATLGTLGILVAGYRTGHSGGRLVYGHNAASAYANAAASGGQIQESGGDRDDE